MQNDKKTERHTKPAVQQYVFIIPAAYNEIQHQTKHQTNHFFLLSYPGTYEQCVYNVQFWAHMEKCPKEKIQIVPCYIPSKDFQQFRSQGTYCTENELNKFLKKNNSCKKHNNFSVSHLSIFTSVQNTKSSDNHDQLNRENTF